MPGTELFGNEERKEVNDVLETGILFRYNHDAQRNNIWKAREFEAEVRKVTGASYAHAVSSGSTAVSCALAAAGIGAGDEVIVPPFTFIASVEAVLFCGALPVFAEIDETLCLSAAGIRAAITEKTKAVLLVHMCGGMANMDEILKVCTERNITLVEDAGQAFGATYKGKSVGLFGKTGSYSFDFFKIATCGEGGVMVTNEETCYQNADCYSDHGHSHVGNNRGMEPHPLLGFNFRIGEINAAIGLAQTRKLPFIIEKNRQIKNMLMTALSPIKGISFSYLPDPSGDSATFLNIFLPQPSIAQKVVEELNKAGVTGFNYWYANMYHFINQWDHLKKLKSTAQLPIHILGIPQNYNALVLPKSQEVVGRLISFGIRCTWKQEDVQKLAEQIANCVEKTI